MVNGPSNYFGLTTINLWALSGQDHGEVLELPRKVLSGFPWKHGSLKAPYYYSFGME